MRVAVVDSNVLIAYVLSRDQDHDRGAEIVRRADEGKLPRCRVTNYVLGEVLNYLHNRAGQDVALDTLDRLEGSPGFEVDHCARSDFSDGMELFREYDRLTFVDSVTVAYMKREGIEYLYSFDDDFDGVDGVTHLGEAVVPD
ncbi:MAG: PIN domain-containing protein [Halobacteriales archaeon]|nr:PIN domain-containing protein [Halobacteriales archaeon]